ncbi:hypothetical protein GCM10027423_58730 [Spirosoma arcticum]
MKTLIKGVWYKKAVIDHDRKISLGNRVNRYYRYGFATPSGHIFFRQAIPSKQKVGGRDERFSVDSDQKADNVELVGWF